jgi:hypothetical protein
VQQADLCTCPAPIGQGQLFETGSYRRETPPPVGARPPVETAASGHLGFWYRVTPEIFLGRRGVGPLLLALDTGVLIEFVDALLELNEAALMQQPPLYGADWVNAERSEAITDVVQLWYHRDVRFLISDIYLVDSKKPLSDERLRVRHRVIRELDFDCHGLRGGTEARLPFELSDDVLAAITSDTVGCCVHPDATSGVESFPAPPSSVNWPTWIRDKQLLADALQMGAHAFLTYDEQILKRAKAFERYGIKILAPFGLLSLLDDAGELEHEYSTLIDLDTLARIWKIAADASTEASS